MCKLLQFSNEFLYVKRFFMLVGRITDVMVSCLFQYSVINLAILNKLFKLRKTKKNPNWEYNEYCEWIINIINDMSFMFTTSTWLFYFLTSGLITIIIVLVCILWDIKNPAGSSYFQVLVLFYKKLFTLLLKI